MSAVPISAGIVLFVMFLVWNNFPDFVEMVGQFLVAHARAIRERSKLFKELTNGTPAERP